MLSPASSSYENPCTSVKSLSNFLKNHRDSPDESKFSKHHPICPSAALNHIHVVIPFYNLDEETVRNAIESVSAQEYPRDRLTIWVYDDASDSNTTSACDNVFEFPIPAATDTESWIHAYQVINELGLSTTDKPDLLCFRSTKHLGPGGGKYWLLGLVRAIAEPNDVVLILDGDDTLLHNQALQIVNKKYIDTLAWFTYGTYEGRWSEQIIDLPSNIREGTKKFKPRKQKWVFGHPRSFKAHLLDHITPDDFKHSDGSWLIKGTDRGLIYRMLELSGPDRIGYIASKIYKYNYSPTTSTMATVNSEVRVAQIHHTKKMVSSVRLDLPIHVVLLAWQRIFLLKDQMIWLQQQTGLGDRKIHLHVVNNNWMEKDSVDEAVESFKLWQIEQIHDSVKSNSTFPIKVTVVHNTGKLHHNFARFVYVNQLRRKTPLDEVIFLDDDQYWPPDFISLLLEEHKPKGITTWYGKTFQVESDGIAKYWKPIHGLFDLIRGKYWVESSMFKYGGTGGSIWDANLWLLESQLMRLTKDLASWSKIDDLWASYVLDALLGWEIRRLKPHTVPIDIGGFRMNGPYHHILSKHITTAAEKQLMNLQLPKQKSILKVSTWSDPNVDKQDMFQELQTTFGWNVDSSEPHLRTLD